MRPRDVVSGAWSLSERKVKMSQSAVVAGASAIREELLAAVPRIDAGDPDLPRAELALRSALGAVLDWHALGDRTSIVALHEGVVRARDRLAARREDELAPSADALEWRLRLLDAQLLASRARPRIDQAPAYAMEATRLTDLIETLLAAQAAGNRDGLSTSELAEAMGTSSQHVSNLLAKAREPSDGLGAMVVTDKDGSMRRHRLVSDHPLVRRVEFSWREKQLAQQDARAVRDAAARTRQNYEIFENMMKEVGNAVGNAWDEMNSGAHNDDKKKKSFNKPPGFGTDQKAHNDGQLPRREVAGV